MNHLLGTAAIWPIEFAINQILKSDEHLTTVIQQFDGRLLEIESTSPSLSICIRFQNNQIHLSSMTSHDLAIKADAKVATEASRLLQLLTSSPDSSALSNPDIKISGDAQFVHEVFKTSKNFDLNWDDLVAPIMGDHLTHLLKNSSDNFKQWSNKSNTSLKASVSEYLTEESRLLPTPPLLEQFGSRMDALKLRIDRAHARLAWLNKQLEN